MTTNGSLVPPLAVDIEALADSVAAKLAAMLGAPRPSLTKRELADALRLTTAQIDRHARAGMPRHYVGKQSPRFYLEECRAWLAERYQEDGKPISSPTPTSTLGIPGVRRITKGGK